MVTGLTLIEEVVAPVLHSYVPVPYAINEAVSPAAIVTSGPALTAAAGYTVTSEESVCEQLPDVPVTVYVVVADGEATTVDPVVELRPAAGLHV